MKKIVDSFYPWCASPLSGLNFFGRRKAFKNLLRKSKMAKANLGLFSEN